jgi:multidrug resistance efflux pump
VVVVVLLALVVVGAVLFGRWLVYRLSHSITGDAFVESDMINLAPQVPGEIVEMLVQDNQRVAKGERLCRIDLIIYADGDGHGQPEVTDADLAPVTA